MTPHNDNIIKELKEISPLLATISRAPVFHLPPDYFNTLADYILLKINKNDSKSGVPEGYFDNLADEILMKIRNEQETSPLLESIGKQNPHFVPSGYFNSLPDSILEKAKKPEPRVISISLFARYAAAAVITGILGLGLFSRMNNKTESYDMAPVLAQAENIIRTGSFESELNTLSDSEIIEYLESNGHDVEAAVVASASESHDLPDPMDYVLQENTLDEFMDKLNIAE